MCLRGHRGAVSNAKSANAPCGGANGFRFAWRAAPFALSFSVVHAGLVQQGEQDAQQQRQPSEKLHSQGLVDVPEGVEVGEPHGNLPELRHPQYRPQEPFPP